MSVLTPEEAIQQIYQSPNKGSERRTSLGPCGRVVYQDSAAVCQNVDTQSMSATFVMTTSGPAPNRNGNRVQIKSSRKGGGIRLDNFAKNPVNFFDHGMNPAFPLPIGTSVNPDTGQLEIDLKPKKAIGTVFFSQRSKEAEQIFALVDEGIIRAASIMYMPLKTQRLQIENEDGEGEAFGFDFLESDLWEWGPVGIGADPDAVRAHIESGSLCEPVCQLMKPYAAEKKAQGVGFSLDIDQKIVGGPELKVAQIDIEAEPLVSAFNEINTDIESLKSEISELKVQLEADPDKAPPLAEQIAELREDVSSLWDAVREQDAEAEELSEIGDELRNRFLTGQPPATSSEEDS